MRLPAVPPAWRQLARGEPWTLAAIAAGLLGAAWILNPASVAERIRDRHDELAGREPNPTGRALGYSAGVLRSPVVDPLEVLARRAAVARAGTTAPTYRAGASDYFRDFVPTQHEVTWPLPPQNLRGLGAQAPVRGPGVGQPNTGVATTAADVLRLQRGEVSGG